MAVYKEILKLFVLAVVGSAIICQAGVAETLFLQPSTEQLDFQIFKRGKKKIYSCSYNALTEESTLEYTKAGLTLASGSAAKKALNKEVRDIKRKLEKVIEKSGKTPTGLIAILADAISARKLAGKCNTSTLKELLMARYKEPKKQKGKKGKVKGTSFSDKYALNGSKSCPELTGFVKADETDDNGSLSIPDDLIFDTSVTPKISIKTTGVFKSDLSFSESSTILFLSTTDGKTIPYPFDGEGEEISLAAVESLPIGNYTFSLDAVTVVKNGKSYSSCSTSFPFTVKSGGNSPDNDGPTPPGVTPTPDGQNPGDGNPSYGNPTLSFLSPSKLVAKSKSTIVVYGKDFAPNVTQLWAEVLGSQFEYPGVTIGSSGSLSFELPPTTQSYSVGLRASNDGGKTFSNKLTLEVVGSSSDSPPQSGDELLTTIYAQEAFYKSESSFNRAYPEVVSFGVPFASAESSLLDSSHPYLKADPSSGALPVAIYDLAGKALPFEASVNTTRDEDGTVEWARFKVQLPTRSALQPVQFKIYKTTTPPATGNLIAQESGSLILINNNVLQAKLDKTTGVSFNHLKELLVNGTPLANALSLELKNDVAYDIRVDSVDLKNGELRAEVTYNLSFYQGSEKVLFGSFLLRFDRDTPNVLTRLALRAAGDMNRQISYGAVHLYSTIASGGAVTVPQTLNSPSDSIFTLNNGSTAILKQYGNQHTKGWDAKVEETAHPIHFVAKDTLNYQGFEVLLNSIPQYSALGLSDAPTYTFLNYRKGGLEAMVTNNLGRTEWGHGVAATVTASDKVRLDGIYYISGLPDKFVIAHDDLELREVTFTFDNSSALSARQRAHLIDRPSYAFPLDEEDYNVADSLRFKFANLSTESKVMTKLGLGAKALTAVTPSFNGSFFRYEWGGSGGGTNNDNSDHDWLEKCMLMHQIGYCQISVKYSEYRSSNRTPWNTNPVKNPEVATDLNNEDLAHMHLYGTVFNLWANEVPFGHEALVAYSEFLEKVLASKVNKYERPLSNTIIGAQDLSRYFKNSNLLESAKPIWIDQMLFGTTNMFTSDYGWATEFGVDVDPEEIATTYTEQEGPDAGHPFASRGFITLMLSRALMGLNSLLPDFDPIHEAATIRAIQNADYAERHMYIWDSQNPANNEITYGIENLPELNFNVYSMSYGLDHPGSDVFAWAFLNTGDQRYLNAFKNDLIGFIARNSYNPQSNGSGIRTENEYRDAVFRLWNDYFKNQ